MAPDDAGVPVSLQPRLREVPALAWTVAQAYSVLPAVHGQWPAGWVLRVMAAAWVVPAWLLLYLPVVLLCVCRGELARQDRHGVVIVQPTGRVLPPPRSTGLLLLWVVLTSSLLVVPVVVVSWLFAVTLLPVAADGLGLLHRVRRAKGAMSAARRRGKALTAAGMTVRTIGLYAAHPPRRGHGGALLEQLAACAPREVWLLAVAANPTLAQRYRRFGFHPWDPHRPLLLERPSATTTDTNTDTNTGST